MLYQEADAFVSHDEDIGCIEQLQMNIKLTDNEPVQKKYLSIPRPLYPEVKAYIEDLQIGSLSGNPHPHDQCSVHTKERSWDALMCGLQKFEQENCSRPSHNPMYTGNVG